MLKYIIGIMAIVFLRRMQTVILYRLFGMLGMY